MLLALGILFLIVGLTYGIAEKEFGGMFATVGLGVALVIIHFATAESRRKKKELKNMTMAQRLDKIEQMSNTLSNDLEELSEDMVKTINEQEE